MEAEASFWEEILEAVAASSLCWGPFGSYVGDEIVFALDKTVDFGDFNVFYSARNWPNYWVFYRLSSFDQLMISSQSNDDKKHVKLPSMLRVSLGQFRWHRNYNLSQTSR